MSLTIRDRLHDTLSPIDAMPEVRHCRLVFGNDAQSSMWLIVGFDSIIAEYLGHRETYPFTRQQRQSILA